MPTYPEQFTRIIDEALQENGETYNPKSYNLGIWAAESSSIPDGPELYLRAPFTAHAFISGTYNETALTVCRLTFETDQIRVGEASAGMQRIRHHDLTASLKKLIEPVYLLPAVSQHAHIKTTRSLSGREQGRVVNWLKRPGLPKDLLPVLEMLSPEELAKEEKLKQLKGQNDMFAELERLNRPQSPQPRIDRRQGVPRLVNRRQS